MTNLVTHQVILRLAAFSCIIHADLRERDTPLNFFRNTVPENLCRYIILCGLHERRSSDCISTTIFSEMPNIVIKTEILPKVWSATDTAHLLFAPVIYCRMDLESSFMLSAVRGMLLPIYNLALSAIRFTID